MEFNLDEIRKEFPIGCVVEDCFGQRDMSIWNNSFEVFIDRTRDCILFGGVFIYDNKTGRKAKVIKIR